MKIFNTKQLTFIFLSAIIKAYYFLLYIIKEVKQYAAWEIYQSVLP